MKKNMNTKNMNTQNMNTKNMNTKNMNTVPIARLHITKDSSWPFITCKLITTIHQLS